MRWSHVGHLTKPGVSHLQMRTDQDYAALRETLREVLDLLWQVRDIWQVMDARALIEKALRQ